MASVSKCADACADDPATTGNRLGKPSYYPTRAASEELEPGKWVRIGDWKNAAVTLQEILDCVARYDTAAEKPHFEVGSCVEILGGRPAP